MNDARQTPPGNPRRRRSRRAVATFIAVTLAFALAVGVSRCLEIEALRSAAQP